MLDWLLRKLFGPGVPSASELREASLEAKRKARRREHLKTMPYREYLQTPEWKAKRDKVVARDGNKCTKCGSTYRLEVHHLTYERRGHERYSDLETLCRECHQKEYEKWKLSSRQR